MSIAVIFILYFGIKKTNFHGDTDERGGQYLMLEINISVHLEVP